MLFTLHLALNGRHEMGHLPPAFAPHTGLNSPPLGQLALTAPALQGWPRVIAEPVPSVLRPRLHTRVVIHISSPLPRATGSTFVLLKLCLLLRTAVDHRSIGVDVKESVVPEYIQLVAFLLFPYGTQISRPLLVTASAKLRRCRRSVPPSSAPSVRYTTPAGAAPTLRAHAGELHLREGHSPQRIAKSWQ